jgi:hypothetical protein
MAQNGLRSIRTVTHFALLLGVAAMACGVTAKQSDFSGPGAGGSSGTAGTSSGDSSGAGATGSSSGVGSLSGSGSGSYLTSGSTVGPITDAGGTASASDSGRQPRCTDAGCTCFNIASIGHLGSYGNGSTELINWLNTESSATVALYQTKPTLTMDFLNQYDVIILQWLSDGNGGRNTYWQFSQTEVQNLGAWVQAGGGLITLSGFEPTTGEVGPLNNLLSFSDISYNTDDILGTCPGALMCSCWGNTVPVGPWAPGPIGDNITQVGAYHGRSINPGSATVDALGDDDGGNVVYAAHETFGAGHIFSWCDEWVTYTSQWIGVPAGDGGTDPYTDPTNACYQQSASQVFQVPQFWYNAISYAAQATSCSFSINNPKIIPR